MKRWCHMEGEFTPKIFSCPPPISPHPKNNSIRVKIVQFDTAWKSVNICLKCSVRDYCVWCTLKVSLLFWVIIAFESCWCWCCCLINLVSSEVPAQSSRIPNGVLHYSTYMIWLTWELSIRPEADWVLKPAVAKILKRPFWPWQRSERSERACNGWGPGAHLRPRWGSRGWPPRKI